MNCTSRLTGKTGFFFLRFELLLVGCLDVTVSFYSFGLVLAILDNVSVRFYLPTILDTFSYVLLSGKKRSLFLIDIHVHFSYM